MGYWTRRAEVTRARLRALAGEHTDEPVDDLITIGPVIFTCDGCGQRASAEVCDAEGWISLVSVSRQSSTGRDYCPRCSHVSHARIHEP